MPAPMTKEEQKLEDLNREKYGEKQFDVISEGYRINKHAGHAYCALNIKKYLRRFISKSPKANNLMDLYKSRDFLNRMIEVEELERAENPIKEIVEK